MILPLSNISQIEYWNATAGLTWAEFQAPLDRQIEPLGAEALRVLAPVAGERILDVGCGCGQTTLDLSARVGSRGQVLGVDISAPMLEVARRRAGSAPVAPLEFKLLDAQSGGLGTNVFDAAYSRFGVMFFSDPVAAFSNILAALKPAGRFAFVCWRQMLENEWMLLPLQAALPFLPPAAPTDPLAPGPFAFADPERVRRLLHQAGFGAVDLSPFDAEIGGGDLDQSVQLAFRVGPLGAALRENPQCKDLVARAVREAMARHLTAGGVRMRAAVWIVLATKH